MVAYENSYYQNVRATTFFLPGSILPFMIPTALYMVTFLLLVVTLMCARLKKQNTFLYIQRNHNL